MSAPSPLDSGAGPSNLYNAPPPLPSGWTQHTAPNGQAYYFHAATGDSTHAHPSTLAPPLQYTGPPPPLIGASSISVSEKKPKKEKPKHKDPIPGADGWLRVTTNLGNVFYTHTATKRSEWTVPDEIKTAVEQLEATEANLKAQPADLQNDIIAPTVDPEPTTANDSETLQDEELDATDGGVQGMRKRGRTSHLDGDLEPGIDVRDLLSGPAVDSVQDEAEDVETAMTGSSAKKQKTSDVAETRDDTHNEENAEETAAEVEVDDEQSAPSIQPVSKPPPPSAPPLPPLPPAASIHIPPPPPGGYRGPPPGFSSPPIQPPSRPLLSVDEGKALFRRMLSTLNGTPEEVNPMAPWDKELPKFVHLSDYTALALLRDRQDAFNEWCKNRLKEKRDRRRIGAASTHKPLTAHESLSESTDASSAHPVKEDVTPAEVYRKLLVDNAKSTRARFEDFRKEFKKDRRFYAFGRDDREREKHFKAHLKELGEQKRIAAEVIEHKFVVMLDEVARESKDRRWISLEDKELKEVWLKVKQIGNMSKREEYDAVGSSSRRAELFVKWARGDINPSLTSVQEASPNGGAPTPADSLPVDKEQDAKHRREKALRERQEQVKRERQEVERRNRRALGEATRGDSAIHFGELLIDAVRDPLSTWPQISEQLSGDARFEAPGLGIHHKLQMFEEHKEKLTNKKRTQLHDIFLKYAPALESEAEVILPLVRDDAEYERLKLGDFVSGLREMKEQDALEEEWKFWKRERETKSRAEFDEMLKENTFVEFWGRLRSEASLRASGEGVEEEASTQRALGQQQTSNREDDEDSAIPSLVEMANQVDIEEIHSILRNDQRYRTWRHEPEKRDRWIRDYLGTLTGRKQTVFQSKG